MCNEYSIIITTYPGKESAKEIAVQLVEHKMAASVQMFPIESVYRWKGEVCEANEIVLMIRTKTGLFSEVSSFIKSNHPYELPEIIQIPIADGLPDYLCWIGENTK